MESCVEEREAERMGPKAEATAAITTTSKTRASMVKFDNLTWLT
jgi:hypothetical protein